MQFIYQPLAWGFLLVGVPILIHLINMLRHRRQKWAAMDFLLESYRRNRRWVLLKQWLLLAARMLAMLLLVVLLASWVTGSQWMSWLGGRTTHHYVLLDDSMSMGETELNETAYDRALQALSGLLRSIAARPGQHQLTLVRFSRARLVLENAGEDARLDSAADLLAQSVPPDPTSLIDRLQSTDPSPLAVSPNEALELVAPLITENSNQLSEVYLLSDLRRNEFSDAEELRNQLQSVAQNTGEIHVVDCGRSAKGNLSIVSLAPELEVWAAGVPLMVRFQIRNRSNVAAKNVVVRVRAVSYGEGLVKPQVEQQYSGITQDLPSVVIEAIAPGETVTRQVQVVFGVPGNHVVEVRIDDDALPADNRRWCSINIQTAAKVLLVDGDIEQRNAFYVQSVINPNPRLKTGIQAETQDAAFLRDVAPDILAAYDVVALLDVPRLDPQAVDKLENYAQSGGGIFLVGGQNTNLKFANDALHRDGDGFLPVRLKQIIETQESLDRSEPQVVAASHPVLAPLLQMENSPFSLLQIRKYLQIEASTTLDDAQQPSLGQQPAPEQNPTYEIVARGPGEAPLILDYAYGRGRVLAMLTGLSNDWSNWAQDPTFVVLTLRSIGYLGSFRRPATSASAGDDIEMVRVGQPVLPEAEVLIPSPAEGVRLRLQRQVENIDDGNAARLSLKVDLDGKDRDLTSSLLRAGVFETWMTTAIGEAVVENHARNVPAVEGDLERVSSSELQQSLKGVPLDLQTAEAISSLGTTSPDTVHSTLLIALLGLLLIGEQLLAYSASYHATPLKGVRQ